MVGAPTASSVLVHSNMGNPSPMKFVIAASLLLNSLGIRKPCANASRTSPAPQRSGIARGSREPICTDPTSFHLPPQHDQSFRSPQPLAIWLVASERISPAA